MLVVAEKFTASLAQHHLKRNAVRQAQSAFSSLARTGRSQRMQAFIYPHDAASRNQLPQKILHRIPPKPCLDQCPAFVDDITRCQQSQRSRFKLQKMPFRLRVKRIVPIKKGIEPAGVHEDAPHRIASAHARSWDFKSSIERDEYFPASDAREIDPSFFLRCRNKLTLSRITSERLRPASAPVLLRESYCQSSNWICVLIMME